MDILLRKLNLIAPRLMGSNSWINLGVRSFSMLTTRVPTKTTLPTLGEPQHLLAPVPRSAPLFGVPSCGFKVVVRLKKRCKDCYLMTRARRMYVLCKTHPRHKQMGYKAEPKHTWILTHASQSPIRPW